MTGVWTTLFAVLFISGFSHAGNGNDADDTEFTIDELKGRIHFLAADYLGGRVTGETGYEIAAEYVRSQFVAAGLKPLATGNDDSNSYYHAFKLLRNDYFTDAPIRVSAGKNISEFKINEDFKIIRSVTGGMVNPDLETVFIGFGIEEPEENWNDYEGLEVEGRNVLILPGAPVKKGQAVLSPEKHEQYASRKGLNKKLVNLMGKNPATIMVVVDTMLQDYYDRVPNQTRVFSNEYHGSDYRMEMRPWFLRLYLVKTQVAEAMLAHTGHDIHQYLNGKLSGYQTTDLDETSVNIPVRIEQKEITGHNVLGMIPGTDSMLSKEYLVIGGHLDHEPNFDGRVNNGADDNASGVTTVLELAQYFARNPLKRSVIFAAWAAEEGGCYGSRNFVETFPGGADQIAAAMNFDCVGRNGRKAEDRFQTYMLDAVKVCPDMLPLVDRINQETVKFRIEKELIPRWGTSDQESFINAGIPVVDFFNGGTADLHRPTDDAEKIDFEYLQKMCILGSAIAEELGNRQERMCTGKAL